MRALHKPGPLPYCGPQPEKTESSSFMQHVHSWMQEALGMRTVSLHGLRCLRSQPGEVLFLQPSPLTTAGGIYGLAHELRDKRLKAYLCIYLF